MAVDSKALLAGVGTLYLAFKVLGLLRVLFDVYVRSGINLKKFGAGQGAWAVITGASDGIGKEFAQQLAQKGFNLLLVSRTASKLQTIAEELTAKHGIEVETYAMDFAKGDPEDYLKLATMMQELQIGVLVNNVGTNHDIPTAFVDESDKVIQDIIEVNINSALRMTKLVLPQMVGRRNGLILNLGSFSGLVAAPYLSVYSAGKAFLSTFSQALGHELEGTGVVVEHINTYFVVSSMSKIRRPTWLIPMPKPYVKSVLNKIGVSGGAAIPFGSTPYSGHALANWAIDNLFGIKFWVKQNLAIQKDIRRRALRKREREAAAKRD
ncbi:hypothetical protein BZG36_01947 [Bifiguratus adelaidae]|uniref:Very-long-chain 3-oxoacyl-CoA reductase n=1 Tax=Bifiguratus adelaidae TaxID=1938954 RepID=A0A261Y3R6_9FUNG|nr:hypothetical protein BZG36_01947 [Bifiguratus adelaidae]